ncbi:hypothetical protein GKA01_15870 [Gluconobacter kanchanaburiensis NBRC 103587]|uniref:Uncharacterized protein n=1 Tax=Gluconobacter kanchanaburiensis NBRC 103587 TaxID=1307948 RepID=A0A511B7E6_9PROT|nr:hypothetical protein AA103587_0861 [Gluconobacter kanchanaburiensis NBRC 103587]GEK96390.1 hypothetical protein GKA01_15870 [Gluconobacter kanchanaburiensis NBRC 103587]
MTVSGKDEKLRVGDVILQAIGNAALLVFLGTVLWFGRETGLNAGVFASTGS